MKVILSYSVYMRPVRKSSSIEQAVKTRSRRNRSYLQRKLVLEIGDHKKKSGIG